jgi:hypothetical protein
MSGLKRSGLSVLVSVATSLSIGSWANRSSAQGESGVQACASAYEDAQVQRNGGHLKAAKEQLKICVQDQCPDFVRTDCATWLSEVNAALPTVTFAAVDSAGADLIDVKVSVDGVVVVESLDGRAVEVDPGQHSLVFEYQGQRVEQKLLVRQGEKNRVVRGQLKTDKDSDADGVLDSEDACPAEAGDKLHAGCAAPDEGSGDVATPSHSGIHPLLLGSFISGGVGAAGFITAGIFELLERSEADAAIKECETGCTDERTEELIASNQRKADVQTVGLIVGGVGLVTGGVLFYLWMQDEQGTGTPATSETGAAGLHLDVVGGTEGGLLQLQGSF